jgi:hypothetical protein
MADGTYSRGSRVISAERLRDADDGFLVQVVACSKHQESEMTPPDMQRFDGTIFIFRSKRLTA